jgi:histidine triad (HIT) family protein
MTSIFTRIVRGEIPCHKIAETEDYLAFLDIRPLAKGHTLVIPKQEIDYFFDLDDALLSGLMVFAKGVAAAIRAEVPCQRIGVAVVGLEVPHAHVHLIPIQSVADISFAKKPLSLSDEEMTRIAAAIRQRYMQADRHPSPPRP